MFDNLFPENLYHSYLVEGDPEVTTHELYNFLKERGDLGESGLDSFYKVYDSFTVSDIHEIRLWHNEKKVGDKKKVCVIGAKFINSEAEKTLLKIIEEPGLETHFFIVTPNPFILLDTIKSRSHIVSIKKLDDENVKKEAIRFISLNKKEKIDFVTNLLKEYKKYDSSSYSRLNTLKFITEIERIFHEKFKSDKDNFQLRNILKELEEKKEYLNLPGASVKMILEHLALVI